jgi:hypothetical protein
MIIFPGTIRRRLGREAIDSDKEDHQDASRESSDEKREKQTNGIEAEAQEHERRLRASNWPDGDGVQQVAALQRGHLSRDPGHEKVLQSQGVRTQNTFTVGESLERIRRREQTEKGNLAAIALDAIFKGCCAWSEDPGRR